MRFLDQYRNARKLVKQIRNGEWEPVISGGTIYKLSRKDKTLWVANGAMFLKIEWKIYIPKTDLPDYFGIWKYYAWVAAVREFVRANMPSVSTDW